MRRLLFLAGILIALMAAWGSVNTVGHAQNDCDEYTWTADDGTTITVIICPPALTPYPPTATPTPTDTPMSTAEPTQPPIEPTPTPELTPPVVTPGPTHPPLKVCTLRSTYVVNVRSGAGIQYGIRDKWLQGAERTFSRFDDSDRDYLWGYSDEGAGGWSAVYDKAANQWFVAGTQAAELCPEVEGWPPGLIPPQSFAWTPPDNPRGVHLLPGANCDLLLNHIDDYGIVKGISSTDNCIQRIHAFRPDMLLIWRNIVRKWHVGDGPRQWGADDPVQVARDWWQAEYEVWQALGLLNVVDLFEYRNELSFMGDWEIAFDLEMIRLANQAGVCLAMFSDGYGNPHLTEFDQRRPVLDAMLGTCHVISAHSYGAYDSPLAPWTVWRWQMQRDRWRAMWGDVYDSIQWVFTEFGVPNLIGEYDGRGVPDCPRAVREMAVVDPVYIGAVEVLGYAIFAYGPSPEWLDWGACLE